MVSCNQCSTTIHDPFYISTEDGLFHEQCLVCCMCRRQLHRESRCFRKLGFFYCADDYEKTFKSKNLNAMFCAACSLPIQSGQQYLSGLRPGLIHHTECFRCAFCGFLLGKGHLIRLQGQLPVCADHQEHQRLNGKVFKGSLYFRCIQWNNIQFNIRPLHQFPV